MPLIIDGNNVLLADKPDIFAGLDEFNLCKALIKSKWIKQEITIYFDGHRTPLTETFSPSPKIEIIYSKSKKADYLIIDKIQASTAPGNLTVVSSDNDILVPAKKRRCKCKKSSEFLLNLASEISIKNKPNKLNEKPLQGNLTKEQVDSWLEDFGIENGQ